jgi:hypothetical protein
MKKLKCQKCNNEFPCRIKINEKFVSLYKRNFCLECSPYGKHNTKDITKIQNYVFEKNGVKYKKCPLCNNILELLKNYFVRKNGKFHYYCKSCLNKRSIQFQNDKKDECIKYKGGKCIICGYNRCRNALEFHHLDQKNKDFEIGYSIRRKKIEEIKLELDKCVLLCSNCHRELHGEYIKL